MELRRPPIEPPVTDAYLNSYRELVPVVAPLFNENGGKSPFVFTPSVLIGLPFRLTISSSFITQQKLQEYLVTFQIQTEKGRNINRRKSGCNLRFTLISSFPYITTGGYFINRSYRKVWRPNNPILNITGIIAPWEDAICQSLANRYHKDVFRLVKTTQNPNSRLVKNYLRRGYNIDGNSYDCPIIITKTFKPQATT